MRPYLLLCFTLLVLPFSMFSQAPFVFEKKEHNFGKIYETSGHVTTQFEFTNTGKEPLVVTSVDVSCGCTAPDYIRDSVMPGEKGWIKAQFDPKGRPGSFEKYLFVTFNHIRSLSTQLQISGEVIPKFKKPTSYTYEVSYGSLSFNRLRYDLGNLDKEGTYTDLIYVANNGTQAIRILKIGKIGKDFKFDFPESIAPGDSAILKISITKKALESVWGDFSYKLTLVTNDPLIPTKNLFIDGKTTQDFSHLTKEEKKNAPVINVEKKELDMGTLRKGGQITGKTTITNKGKTPLIIRNIHAPCFCLKGEMNTLEIAPGASAELTLKFDSLGQKPGPLTRGVTLYSNDPNNPELIVYAKVNIVEK